jgi:hypothetical protein
MTADHNPQQRDADAANDWLHEEQAVYVDGLGFQVDWEHRCEPGFPVFAQVSRDGLAFFLTEHTGDCPVGGLIHLYVNDVDALFEEFRGRSIQVQEPANESLSGLRSMMVVDPDGNKLHVCTRLPDWRRWGIVFVAVATAARRWNGDSIGRNGAVTDQSISLSNSPPLDWS